MLQNRTLLLNAKNLLAFSAGVDSTALLFLLLKENITFDIAIVNYGVRPQAKEELLYAQKLANQYNFTCHTLDANISSANFEANARAVRYNFFEELIKKYDYTNLLTAHHLGDRFEWMLMQFCKGAGCAELSGMQAVDKRKNYTLLRPLLHLDKTELLEYLNNHSLLYFEDASNSDEKYTRNEFRHNYAKPLLKKYLTGIKKSFEYIEQDKNRLIQEVDIGTINNLAYFKVSSTKRSDIYTIDKYLKMQNHLITAQERELLKSQNSLVVGRKYVVAQRDDYILIAPYLKVKNIDKELKEKMRLLKIDPKLRPYLSGDSEAVEFLSLLLA